MSKTFYEFCECEFCNFLSLSADLLASLLDISIELQCCFPIYSVLKSASDMELMTIKYLCF